MDPARFIELDITARSYCVNDEDAYIVIEKFKRCKQTDVPAVALFLEAEPELEECDSSLEEEPKEDEDAPSPMPSDPILLRRDILREGS
jgi:hypothetical protein